MLRSGSIVLAPLTEADSETLFKWINDRDLVVLSAPYKPVSESQHNAWFQSVLKRPDAYIFGIRTVDESQLVGSCQLHSISQVHRSAELQIRIGDSASRGRGYGTDAVRALQQFAFSDLDLHRIQLSVFATNAAAVHVYEKTGFKKEARMREAAFIEGRFIDVLVMGILRTDWRG
jgi:RimJ/RimL family protein N-acetyltransferase